MACVDGHLCLSKNTIVVPIAIGDSYPAKTQTIALGALF